MGRRTTRSPGVIVLIASVLTVSMLAAGPATAQRSGSTDITIEEGAVVVEAAHPGSLHITDAPGTPHDGPRLECGWFELVTGGSAEIDVVLVVPEVGETYLWYCWTPGDHPILEPFSPTYPVVLVYEPAVNPSGEVLTSPDAARYATNRIDFARPTIALSPPERQIVGVPTWLSVTSELAPAPVSAAAGPVWATVRPEFAGVTWTMGTGEQVVCTVDAATEWQPGGGDGQHSDCTHTFTSGRRAPFAGSATVTWTIWYQSDEDPSGWTVFDRISLTTPVDFVVAELEAAIS